MSEHGLNASQQSLAKQGSEKTMTTSQVAYPTKPRTLVVCSLIGRQSSMVGKGGPAMRNKRQAAYEDCFK